MKIENSLGGDFMRLPEGQEGAGLSGEGPENAELGQEWLGGHCEVRSTPRFQEGTDISDFRKRCAGEGNSAWL